METIDNMTIEQLEQLAQAYFDCELSRREEDDLRAALLFAEAHSPLLDECRLAMGIETIASRGRISAQAPKKKFYHRYVLIASAACLAALICIGMTMFLNNNETIKQNDTTEVTFYANGKRVTDEAQARKLAEEQYQYCMAIVADLYKTAEQSKRNIENVQQQFEDQKDDIRQIKSKAKAIAAKVIQEFKNYQ